VNAALDFRAHGLDEAGEVSAENVGRRCVYFVISAVRVGAARVEIYGGLSVSLNSKKVAAQGVGDTGTAAK
jgi:hypothetical protein